jgi:hypothetical protein
LSDCLVSPDVFHQMVDRPGEFVVPYQQALETEAGQRNVHLYLQGLLSHLPGKNAEDIATFVAVYLSPADNSAGPVWSCPRDVNRTVLPSHIGCPRPG